MATYTLHSYNGITPEVKLQSYELYGSSRLGSLNLGIPVEGDYNLTPTTNYTRSLGLKQYELSNHLGNVLTTFSDQRILAPAGMSSTNSNALIAKLISAQDYYPFGMIMDGRSWNTDKVKFGFNNKEKDNDIYGNDNAYDFGARIFDPRIGRWLSVDPLQKEYPSLSVYQFCANSPIIYKDLDGRRIFIYYEDSEGNPQLWEYKPNLTPPDNEFVKSAVEALNYVYNNSKYGSKIIDQAVATPQSVDIYEEKGADVVFKGYDEEASDNEHIICESEFNRIKWNPTLGLETVPNSEAKKHDDDQTKKGTGEIQSPALGLVHELIHFLHKAKNEKEWYRLQNTTDNKYDDVEERRTTRKERKIADELGEPKRRNHGGKDATVDRPTSHKKSEKQKKLRAPSSRNL